MRRRSDNLFRDINFSSHPSLAQGSFIWPLVAAFSSAYILAFLWISFRDTRKIFDLCKVIHSKSISSKSISLIFLLPLPSFFAKLPPFFELTFFVFCSHFVTILLSFFYQPRISAQLPQLMRFYIFACFTTSSLKVKVYDLIFSFLWIFSFSFTVNHYC